MMKFSKEKILLLHNILAGATGGSAGVRDVMGRAMETYGLDFKSSPVLAELEAIKASTSDAHKAATIEAWIKRNGGQVYEEFNNGISETTEAAELFLNKMSVGEADD